MAGGGMGYFPLRIEPKTCTWHTLFPYVFSCLSAAGEGKLRAASLRVCEYESLRVCEFVDFASCQLVRATCKICQLRQELKK